MLGRQGCRRGSCTFCQALPIRVSCVPLTTSQAVRKRYLALALRLHPDKAAHPRAHEAFSALEQAYSQPTRYSTAHSRVYE